MGFEPTRPRRVTGSQGIRLTANPTELLEDFSDFLRIDQQLNESTIKGHIYRIQKFLDSLNSDARTVTKESIREYLKGFINGNVYTYRNHLKSLRVFYRYLGLEHLAKGFKFPEQPLEPKNVPSKTDLQKFYAVLPELRDKALFLMYATSSKRKQEILSLLVEDLNLEEHIFTIRKKSSETKKTGTYGFFNEECEKILRDYIKQENLQIESKLFDIGDKTFRTIWDRARKKTGINITAQTLREWFCEEMGNLNVPDRYIDAFCGRVPKSVLAKHYTDYAPEKLKRIYERAKLKVLS